MNTPLGSWTLGILRAMAATLFDDGTGVPEERLDWLIAEYADYSRAFGAKTRLGFTLAVFAIQCLPLFVVFRPLPMTWLSPATRRRYLEKVEAGPLTVLMTAAKMPLTLVYFEHPDVMATIGYDGLPMLPKPEELLPGALTALATKTKLRALPLLPAAARARTRTEAT